ncbi:hypothetical protein Vretimale_16945 [Volvox reticuliferus]|uniref:Uncharacterized protein n=1 Tax=Volvox reticuliferus TaxID=1737510 RepID=A0A8J4CZV5_9CHLO|nr:hypothetical protein Vretifemale_16774 [Volvox reticuliferus]GIM13876.1 hypothetical protein Vretimale_16945 [Volvox reticuliferus]
MLQIILLCSPRRSTGLVGLRPPCISAAVYFACKHGISWSRPLNVGQLGQQDATKDSGAKPNTMEVDEATDSVMRAPCLRPGGIRAAKLCSLTGLCSRTNVNILNTNMRCPTCLLTQLEEDKPVTFFPAVPIGNTVRLMHRQAYPYQLAPGLWYRPAANLAAIPGASSF